MSRPNILITLIKIVNIEKRKKNIVNHHSAYLACSHLCISISTKWRPKSHTQEKILSVCHSKESEEKERGKRPHLRNMEGSNVTDNEILQSSLVSQFPGLPVPASA